MLNEYNAIYSRFHMCISLFCLTTEPFEFAAELIMLKFPLRISYLFINHQNSLCLDLTAGIMPFIFAPVHAHQREQKRVPTVSRIWCNG
jgi:hypothetical protein